ASTRGQGSPIGRENNSEEDAQPTFGCLGLFPSFPVPQTQATVIAHTGKALPIRSKSHPTDGPEAAAQCLHLFALCHVPDAHSPISTARSQELAILRRKSKGQDGSRVSSQQLALCTRHRLPQTDCLVATPGGQQPAIRGESDSEHLPGMAGQYT